MAFITLRIRATDIPSGTGDIVYERLSFNTEDPENLVTEFFINLTPFERSQDELIWTDPDTGDEYFYAFGEVYFVPGSVDPGPQPEPILDFGLRYLLTYQNGCGDATRLELYERDYTGDVEEVDGGASPLILERENAKSVFEYFRGMNATLTLLSDDSLKYQHVFEGDERKFRFIYKRGGLIKMAGWVIPDIYTEPWKSEPYQTEIKITDGLGGLKDLPLRKPDGTNFSGVNTEFDYIIAALRRTNLDLNVILAVNLLEQQMTGNVSFLECYLNAEVFQDQKNGINQPISCYDALEKILRSYNATIFQQDGKWIIVRIAELYLSSVPFTEYDFLGNAVGGGNLSTRFNLNDFNLHGSTLQTQRAFNNVTVSYTYGTLLTQNQNFVTDGFFDNWRPIYADGKLLTWRLVDWTYHRLGMFPYYTDGGTGRVQRVEENLGFQGKNNFINIYEVIRNFDLNGGYLESKPQPIKKELGNLIDVNFKIKCATKGSDQRLVEAYFVIAVRCGTKWLGATAGVYSWQSSPTLLSWKIAAVGVWENIQIPPQEVPEDGEIVIRLYQIVQVGPVNRVEYVATYDDVIVNLIQNAALVNRKVFYTGTNSNTFTNSLDEVDIALGDGLTIMSQNAKIVDDNITSRWKRLGKTEAEPLARLIAKDYLNNFQKTTFSLSGGQLKGHLNLLGTYEDEINQPGKFFIFTGGTFDDKQCKWSADFIELNQQESLSVIVETFEKNETQGGGNQSNNSSGTPLPPPAPIEIPDGVDNIIPVITDGRFQDSEIRALRDGGGVINEYQFPYKVLGPEGTAPGHFVTKSQLDGNKPIAGIFADQAAMIAAQSVQKLGFIYFDGTQHWEYLGTNTGTIADYRAIGGGSSGGGNFVAWDVAQSLSSSEKRQARENIGLDSGDVQVVSATGNVVIPRGSALVAVTAATNIVGISNSPAPLDGEIVTILNRKGSAFGVLSNNFNSILDLRLNPAITTLTNNSFPNNYAISFRFDASINKWVSKEYHLYVPAIGGQVLNDFTWIGRHTFRPPDGFSAVNFQFQNGAGAIQFAIHSTSLLAYQALRVSTAFNDDNIVLNTNGTIRQNRSGNLAHSVRRDELHLNYNQIISTTGTLNDLAINADTKLLLLAGATELTGVVPVDTTLGRKLIIYASGADRLIRHESLSSSAANRFSIGADMTIPNGTFQEFIYIQSRWRRRMP